jgi:hydrogenase maturation protein HypF
MNLQERDWGKREPMLLKLAPFWHELLGDLRAGLSRQRISARFHSGVAKAFVRAAEAARLQTRINAVAMSGGVMHNRRLARLLRTGLDAEGFQVYQHSRVSPGDGGLSYGQAASAAARLKVES